MGNWAEYLATGITTAAPGDNVPIRKDIRTFNEIELYLYFEGLKRFQAVGFNDPLSWYQIAGIHGRPYNTWPNFDWNNDIPEIPEELKQPRGFCTHSSILFLPWHRPYLALFERLLYHHVNEIAAGISDDSKADYVATAKQFRMPYWDWAEVYPDSQIFPKQALDPKYQPKGPPSTNSVPLNPSEQYNPLHHFPLVGTETARPDPEVIQISDNSDENPRKVDSTVRYPYGTNTKGEIDNLEDALARFYKSGATSTTSSKVARTAERNLTERVGYILRSYASFGAVSSNKFTHEDPAQGPTAHAGTWGSFEDIHNAVHNLTGGSGGHMSGIEVSAFDPIFWLHHTNIDRLFAIWQALHESATDEDTYVTPQLDYYGTWAVRKSEYKPDGQKGDVEDINFPLYPFRDVEDSWYTSEKVRRTEVFGYAYSETLSLSYPLSDDAKGALTKIVRETYPSAAEAIANSKREDPKAGAGLLPQAAILKQIHTKNLKATTDELQILASKLPEENKLIEQFSGPDQPYLHKLAPDNEFLEWIVNIKAQKHALGGQYSVHVFLDAVEDANVALWPLSPHHVGTFAPLGQASDTGCTKCQVDQADHREVTGQIPLTLALMERYLAGLIDDLSVEKVVPYLTKNLHWRVVKSNGSVADSRSEVAGLTVFVVSNKVTLPEDDAQLPVYAKEVDIHPQITTNLEGHGRGDGTGLAVGDV
ncbi:common central domain of tyrosinase-domain-containing protein [Pyrenochaeta sp. MPI-SDFR-AT-0127]|nr:common central domain of tyrosinase-domain-containing protein [Pyrenochaeta sp. MPI-SDFR-AT-0127]